MVAGRVAAGLTLALLLVGAVVHYRPARHVSSDFVSAAEVDLDSLEPCAEEADSATDDKSGELATNDKVCACGKSICTKGRVCVPDPAGKGADKCYLPRCDSAPDTDIPDYVAGCLCGEDDLFTNAKPEVQAFPGMETCTDGKEVEEDVCKCGTNVCTKGQLCSTTDGCDGVSPTVPAFAEVKLQKTAGVMPANLTDPTKFAICKNTNSGGKVACDQTAAVKCAPKTAR